MSSSAELELNEQAFQAATASGEIHSPKPESQQLISDPVLTSILPMLAKLSGHHTDLRTTFVTKDKCIVVYIFGHGTRRMWYIDFISVVCS